MISRHSRTAVLLALSARFTLGAAALGAQGVPADGAAAAANTLPLKATRTHAFTTTKGTWLSLDVSPDGQTIIFDMLGQLYTLPIAGGKATAITSGLAYSSQARFSPDGKKIVYISDRSGGDYVWIMSLDMKDSVQVTKGNDNGYLSPEWTPDGKYVVASKSGGLGGAAKIWMYNVDGGNGLNLMTSAPPMQKTVEPTQ